MLSSTAIVQGQSSHDMKAKRYICYDFYVDENQDLKLKADAELIGDFLSWNKNRVVVVAPTKGKNRAANYSMPGNRCLTNQKFPLITDLGKKIILSAIQSVVENMKDGNCFKPFDETNIVVTPSGKVLFRHVPIVKLDHDSKSRTLQDLYGFIHRLFRNNPIPEDVQHLIDLIGKQEKEVLYNIHPSLTPHSERGWHFNLMYEHVKFKIPPPWKDIILLKIPYAETWRRTVVKNSFLEETYYFRPGSYAPLEGNEITRDAEQIHEARLILDFVRNAIAHRLDRQTSLNADEHETILLAWFPLLLPKLQEAILDVLGEEDFKKIFCKRS